VLLEELQLGIDNQVAGLTTSLGEELLQPTRIYVKTILSILEQFHIKGMAHITGGGLPGNIMRVLPPGTKAIIENGRWSIPPIFTVIEQGGVPKEEMWRTFNNGVGMVLVVAASEAEKVSLKAQECGEQASIIGEIVPGKGVEIV
jgi:phosphoribosylformylglycinamidine cyclo-ligase